MDGLHLADGTSEVYSTIDNMVMQLGNIIQVQSVRLSRPEEMLEEMPPPWRALFVGP
jgi:hypothetical protein